MSSPAAAALASISSSTGRAVRLIGRERLSGGDISIVERLETTDGTYVIKWHSNPPDGLFPAEAAGLRALRDAGSPLRVPEVLAESDTYLLIDDLGSGAPSAGADEAFGQGLAELHRTHASAFGFDRDTFCGTTRQPNAWQPDWRTFYASARLAPQIAQAARTSLLTQGETERLERLVHRLDTLIDEPPDGPSLIHGDLWSGNCHVTADGTMALIDPAVAYAHREAELGMMTTFGGFSRRVFDAYAEAYPLEAGWRERNPLYQLYHWLNHLNLFGWGYHDTVMGVVARFE